MLTMDRDEYAERHKAGPGFFFWAVWVAITIVGTMLGVRAYDAVQRVVDLRSPLDIVPVAMGGAALGAGLGLVQSVALARYLKLRGGVEWALATVMGGILSAVAISMAADTIAGLSFDYSLPGIVSYSLVYALVGAIGGATMGYAQSLVLQRRVINAGWWVLANAGASALYTLFVASFTLHDSPVNTGGGLISGALRGAITGVALVDLLRHPTSEAEWSLRVRSEKRQRKARDVEAQPSPEALLERMREEAHSRKDEGRMYNSVNPKE